MKESALLCSFLNCWVAGPPPPAATGRAHVHLDLYKPLHGAQVLRHRLFALNQSQLKNRPAAALIP